MTRHSFRIASMALIAAVLVFPTFAQSPLPESVDWRAKGAVTPVSDAGQCGSSWAFAAAAAVEGAHAIRSHQLITLSVQELIDCSVDGNHGCSGGSPRGAFEFIKRHGVASEAAYPYTARDGSCHLGRPVAVRITSFRSVKTDMQSLMEAVAKGPVAVMVDGTTEAFQQYGGGIYACHVGTPDVWVTIVGYGMDAAKRHYWLVKNSAGTGWGEHGYMRMARTAECANIGAAFVAEM